ncbi:MAG: hypothetical protein LDL11_06185 [Desulfarculus sp.]|nr:hypothetical protein [Desulfarculus sp.]
MSEAGKTATDPWPGLALLGQHLGLGLLTAALGSVLIWLMWEHLGLPDLAQEGALAAVARPEGLRLFVSLAPPLVVWLPSLVLDLLLFLWPGSRAESRPARRALRLDAYSYLTLPAFLALPLVWRELGNGLAALGLAYLGLAAAKGGLLVWVLWRGFLVQGMEPGEGLGPRRQLAVFLVGLALLGPLAGWSHQALSSASDEVGYLLIAHSLARHATSDVSQAAKDQEYRSFYWARWSPELAFSTRHAGGVFPWLITPAYWLGGRLGVLLLLAAILALTAGQLLAWLSECRLRPGPAAAAAGLTLLSAPVLLISQQVFPDTVGMLLLMVGLRLLLRLEDSPWLRGAGLVLCAVLLMVVKGRLAPLAGGLLLLGGCQLLARRLGWGLVGALAVGLVLLAGAMALWLPREWWPGWVWSQVDVLRWNLERAGHPLQPILILLRGVALDQTFGLAVVAPVFVLALAGIPAGLRLRLRPSLQVLVPLVIYLAVLCYTRWFQWYGGFAGPARFLAAALPPLALFLGLAFSALDRPWLRLLAWLPASQTLLYAWLATLVAQARYSPPLGVNPLLRGLQDNLGLDLHHLLPSAFTRSPAFKPWTLGLAVIVTGLGLLIWRRLARAEAPAAPERPAAAAAPPPAAWSGTELSALALAVLLLLAAGLGAARLWPPTFVEAEQMRVSGGSLYVEYVYPNTVRGAVLMDGGRLQGRLFFPGGEAGLRVVGKPGRPGEVSIVLDGGVVYRFPWRDRYHDLEVPLGEVPRGQHSLELVWSACPERVCAVLVDRLEVVPPSSP